MARGGKSPKLTACKPWDWCSRRKNDESDRDHIVLWHGCLGVQAASIIKNGIDPSRGRPDVDFGRGFYSTTLKRQAIYWAWERYWELSPIEQRTLGNHPVVLRFRISRIELARVEALHFFVRPDHDNEDYWSLVHHCRKSTRTNIHNHKCTNDGAPERDNWYDIVVGPVAAFWSQCVALSGYDQISFHTADAARLLTDLIHSRDRSKFRIEERI